MTARAESRTTDDCNAAVSLPVLDNHPGTRRGHDAGRRDGLDRRSFLRCAGIAGAASLTAAAGAEPTQRVSDDWMGVLTDLTVCVGCRKCEWACRRANGLPNQRPLDAYEDRTVFDRRRRTDAENLTVVNRFDPPRPGMEPVHVKTQCMHCFEPACASACLVGAFRKTAAGPVVYNPSVCIGCRYCMVACPFGAPAYTYDNALAPVVRKCSMCFERIAAEGGRPACVDICPVEAMTFGRRSELIELARRKIDRHPDRYVNHIYGEHEAGGTCWLYLSPVPFEQIGFRTDVGTTPYPELTRGFLSAVPLVLTLWPALLMGAYAFNRRRTVQDADRAAAPAAATPTREENDDG